ncbi:MAG TPA: hypothetical protein VNO24_22860, partial [Blastocatellia bacterium]|nr:hypothetical protein [Blastocatellia bacterium]
MFLLLTAGAFEVFGHYEARAVVSAFELHFIHQGADYLQSAAARPFHWLGAERGGRLSIRPAKRFTFVRDGDYKLIFVDCEALMDFSVRTVAVLGRVETRLDQGGLDLIDRFLIEVGGARYLFGRARGDQLGVVFDGNDEFELAGWPR